MNPTIDKIVNLFFSGKKGTLARAENLYEEVLFEDEGGAREDFEYCGTVIPNESMELDRDNIERLEGHVSEERMDELLNGAEPTEEEILAYRESVIANVKAGDADADEIPGYWIYRLRHTDGRQVFALETVTGYSFSGVSNTFHGLFATVEDALKDLSSWGVVVSGTD